MMIDPRCYVAKLSGAELLVLVPGGVWAPIEFVHLAIRYAPETAEWIAAGLPGAVVLRASCECAASRRIVRFACGNEVWPAATSGAPASTAKRCGWCGVTIWPDERAAGGWVDMVGLGACVTGGGLTRDSGTLPLRCMLRT